MIVFYTKNGHSIVVLVLVHRTLSYRQNAKDLYIYILYYCKKNFLPGFKCLTIRKQKREKKSIHFSECFDTRKSFVLVGNINNIVIHSVWF